MRPHPTRFTELAQVAGARGGASRAVRACKGPTKGMLLCTFARHHPLRPVSLCATAYPSLSMSIVSAAIPPGTVAVIDNSHCKQFPTESLSSLSQFPEICQWFLSRTTYSLLVLVRVRVQYTVLYCILTPDRACQSVRSPACIHAPRTRGSGWRVPVSRRQARLERRLGTRA